MVVLHGAEEEERERGLGERGKEGGDRGFFSCVDHFALAKICHLRQFNEKGNKSTKGSNDTIIKVSLDFLKKFEYQKIYFAIVHVSYFTQEI